jgi:hypothetical protein
MMAQRPQKLLDHVREAIRLKHDSLHTAQAYVTWIKRYMFFHDKRHPKDMGAADIEAFLTHLAVQQKVAASTQNQALSALLFLYRDVLRQPLDGPIDAIRARKPKRLAQAVYGFADGERRLRRALGLEVDKRLTLRHLCAHVTAAQYAILLAEYQALLQAEVTADVP